MEAILPAIFRTVARLNCDDPQEHHLSCTILAVAEVLLDHAGKLAAHRVHGVLKLELDRMWEKLPKVHHTERRLRLTMHWLHLW